MVKGLQSIWLFCGGSSYRSFITFRAFNYMLLFLPRDVYHSLTYSACHHGCSLLQIRWRQFVRPNWRYCADIHLLCQSKVLIRRASPPFVTKSRTNQRNWYPIAYIVTQHEGFVQPVYNRLKSFV